MRSLIFTTAIFLLTSTTLVAAQEYACVQYQREDYTWGDAYKVPAAVVTGDELIKATNEYQYKPYNNYAVIEWPNGGYSAFELQSYRDKLPSFYMQTIDQHNRTYRIKEAPSFGACSAY